MDCVFREWESPVIPPPMPSQKDMILEALGYEEQEMEIGGTTVTLLVKCGSESSLVGEAVVGTAIVGG